MTNIKEILKHRKIEFYFIKNIVATSPNDIIFNVEVQFTKFKPRAIYQGIIRHTHNLNKIKNSKFQICVNFC